MQLHHQRLRGRGTLPAGKEENMPCEVVDDDDTTVATTVVKPQFDTVYTGLDTKIAIQGLCMGYRYAARVRIRDTKEGGRIGTFCDVAQVKIPAKVQEQLRPPVEQEQRDAGDANKRSLRPNSGGGPPMVPRVYLDMQAVKQRLLDMDIDDALTVASDHLHFLIVLAAVVIALFVRVAF